MSIFDRALQVVTLIAMGVLAFLSVVFIAVLLAVEVF